MIKNVVIVLLFLGFFSKSDVLFAQGDKKFIQFSGFIIDSKTEEALPGAYIQVTNAGRGTMTNTKGYFILNVFPGDSIVFSYMGFKKQFHIVPKTVGLNYSAVVELQEDAKMLKEVKVYPFSTEDEFKRALVEMQLPNEKARQILEETFSQEGISRMIAMQAMSADANYRYGMNQQIAQIQKQGQVTTNPLLNPFAWANFIKTIKNGTIKDDSWKSKYENVPREKGGRDAIFKGGN